MPFPPSKRPPRRCALCGHPELTNARGLGRFLLVADPEGRGPVCPPLRGCRMQGSGADPGTDSTLTPASQ